MSHSDSRLAGGDAHRRRGRDVQLPETRVCSVGREATRVVVATGLSEVMRLLVCARFAPVHDL